MPSVSHARTERLKDSLTTVFGWMLQMSSRNRAANMQTVTRVDELNEAPPHAVPHPRRLEA